MTTEYNLVMTICFNSNKAVHWSLQFVFKKDPTIFEVGAVTSLSAHNEDARTHKPIEKYIFGVKEILWLSKIAIFKIGVFEKVAVVEL